MDFFQQYDDRIGPSESPHSYLDIPYQVPQEDHDMTTYHPSSTSECNRDRIYPSLLPGRRFDVIVAADVICCEADVEGVARTLSSRLALPTVGATAGASHVTGKSSVIPAKEHRCDLRIYHKTIIITNNNLKLRQIWGGTS